MPFDGMSGGGGNSGLTNVCAVGNPGCPCFGNDSCVGTLVCYIGICVVPSAAGGATSLGGVMASGGVVGGAVVPAGGTTAIASTGTLGATGALGGSTAVPPGGNTAVAGATGGAILPGGTTATGSGGASAAGGAIPGGTTAVIVGASNTGGANPPGGTTAVVAGTSSTGGANPPGGTTAAAGASALGGNTGTTTPHEVCADATHCTLGLDGSSAPASGNSYGINGTFFPVGDGCATLTWNPQTRCASGTLCAKDPPNYLNWGAEVALNLKTGAGYDYPFDATAAGVTGFFWEITGTAPGMQVWVPLTTNPGECLQSSNTCALSQPPWGNPTPSLGPTGRNYVQLQTTLMSYDQWGSSYVYPPPWDPTRLHSLVWKLPAQTVATSFNFCVQNVGVIHN
jgi:hypothetical protein